MKPIHMLLAAVMSANLLGGCAAVVVGGCNDSSPPSGGAGGAGGTAGAGGVGGAGGAESSPIVVTADWLNQSLSVLDYDKLIDYYQLRFQIEFNFRDAKQFWGLEDFMNIKETQIANAVCLSLFMVNLSHVLLKQMRQTDAKAGVLDLKSFFRGRRYAIETLNLLPESPSPFISSQIVHIVATLGSIHRRSPLRAAAPKT